MASYPAFESNTIMLDVSSLFNNTGFTANGRPHPVGFNVWGNTLPLEHIPWTRPGHVVVGGIEFRLASSETGAPDNFRCSGQFLSVPEHRYDWIHVLAAAERRTEDAVQLHFDEGIVDPEWLRVSDFWPETEPWFGEHHGMRFEVLQYPRHTQTNMGPAVWVTRIPVSRQATLRAMRWPDNPAIHVFGITLQTSRPELRVRP